MCFCINFVGKGVFFRFVFYCALIIMANGVFVYNTKVISVPEIQIEKNIQSGRRPDFSIGTMMTTILKKAAVPVCRHGRSVLRSVTRHRKLHQLSAPSLANAPTITESADGGKAVDVLTKLLRDRIICLMGIVTDDLAEKVMAQLICLHFEDPDKLIRVFINSPGGKVSAGLAIYDTMQYINNPIATLCIGEACSMGSLLLTAGTTGMRYASPNSTIMVHQPLISGMQGYITDLKIKAANMKRTKEQIQDLYVKHTGLTQLVIEKALDRDNYMTPLEAKEFGLIDQIL